MKQTSKFVICVLLGQISLTQKVEANPIVSSERLGLPWQDNDWFADNQSEEDKYMAKFSNARRGVNETKLAKAKVEADAKEQATFDHPMFSVPSDMLKNETQYSHYSTRYSHVPPS